MEVLNKPFMHFDTADFPAEERFDRWRQVMAGFYEVVPPEDPKATPLDVRSSAWMVGGGVMLAAGSFSRQTVNRSRQMIRRDQVDHYKIHLREGGGFHLDADGSRLRIATGNVVIEDLARPERYDGQGGSSIILYVAREVLDEALPRALQGHGVVVQAGAGMLLADYMRSLTRNISYLDQSQISSVAAATTSLIAACLAPTAETLASASPALEVTLLRQISRFIEMHLTDEALSADSLCAVFKISRATLYRLFEPLGGVQSFIKERRLARIHTLLSTAEGRVHLTRIAEAHGFKSATYFSRAFREHFGYTPSDVTTGKGPAAPPVAQAGGEVFMPWLQSMRG
jgi:AraC-like DNA-binding protein